VVGEVQRVVASEEDTLSDIARRFNLGYEEVVRANPGVDPWLPRAGTEIVLPTRYVLPDAPREGVVINLAALRLYYFPPRAEGEPQTVVTHPIGIGRVGWRTPEGTTKVVAKRKDPTWYVPASVRREHAAAGDPLPAQVPPGPDNPLGRHSMRLGWPSYLIHGTNNPYGVGLRNSHGCVRMYPEDIALLFEAVPIGTKVTVVNQPLLYGWSGGQLYLQALPALEDDKRDHRAGDEALLAAALSERGGEGVAGVERALIEGLIADPRGIAVPVSHADLTLEGYLAHAPRVENRLPLQATWDGVDEPSTEEEATGE
jgi:L,D-transpeptidase ErfK/SrfK